MGGLRWTRDWRRAIAYGLRGRGPEAVVLGRRRGVEGMRPRMACGRRPGRREGFVDLSIRDGDSLGVPAGRSMRRCSRRSLGLRL